MIGVIIIGDEILSGRREDKHLAKAIELLTERGMALSWARYLGDEPARITAALKEAFASGDIVFSFGGIGATPDDHTRACAGEALGLPLALHDEARDLILARGREMAEQAGEPFDAASDASQRRLQMGFFPHGARIIPNPYNRIPGFSMRERVHFLPGFPVMAWPMMAWVLDHWHAALHETQRQVEKSALVFGSMESTLTPLMQRIEREFAPVKVFSLPSEDHPQHGRHIDLGVKGRRDQVEAAFEALMQGAHECGASIGAITVRNDA
jgi:molybdopterin-biosynthesis enzyme MoeA-like protein